MQSEGRGVQARDSGITALEGGGSFNAEHAQDTAGGSRDQEKAGTGSLQLKTPPSLGAFILAIPCEGEWQAPGSGWELLG